VGWPQGTTHGQQLVLQPFRLASFPQLEVLSLDVDYLQAGTCAQLSTLTALQELYVGTFLFELPPTLWSSIARMPRLAHLAITAQTQEVEACTIPAAAWQALRGCRLESLALTHCFMGSDDRGEHSCLPARLPVCPPTCLPAQLPACRLPACCRRCWCCPA